MPIYVMQLIKILIFLQQSAMSTRPIGILVQVVLAFHIMGPSSIMLAINSMKSVQMGSEWSSNVGLHIIRLEVHLVDVSKISGFHLRENASLMVSRIHQYFPFLQNHKSSYCVVMIVLILRPF